MYSRNTYFELEDNIYLENESYYQWNENEERNQRNPLFLQILTSHFTIDNPTKKTRYLQSKIEIMIFVRHAQFEYFFDSGSNKSNIS